MNIVSKPSVSRTMMEASFSFNAKSDRLRSVSSAVSSGMLHVDFDGFGVDVCKKLGRAPREHLMSAVRFLSRLGLCGCSSQ